MKLKFYLRGLGVGLIVATIIVGLHSGQKTTEMTDAQIRSRALELGMIDGSVLTGSADGGAESESKKDNASSDQTMDQAGKEISQEINEGKSASTATVSEMAAQTQASAETEKNDSAASASSTAAEQTAATAADTQTDAKSVQEESTVIVIPKGAGSDVISTILENAGLIDSADSFNRYLIDRGLDRLIRAGSKSIPGGASYEMIASIITH
ncbi:MAG: hypothetical protein KA965_07355 [Butyrivibrio sp.]|nr:hypothetical protein [Butyrivibrio sp.]